MESDGKPVVLISGCSSGGIGHALARAFAAEKCQVVATSRAMSSMADLEHDAKFFLQELDVVSDESVQRALSNAIEKFGRIDIVVNNAGVPCRGPLAEIPISAIENTFNTNVYEREADKEIVRVAVDSVPTFGSTVLSWESDAGGNTYNTFGMPRIIIKEIAFARLGSLRLIQAVVPHMASRKKGTIVNIGSVAAFAPGPWVGAYTASKAALHALTDTLRLELRPFGINVVTVVPGAVKSNIWNAAIASYNRMPEWKLYEQFEDAIRARAYFSQGLKPTPSEEFAKKTVAALLQKNPPPWFSYGEYSTIMSIMYHLPIFVKDFLIRKAMKW